MGACAVLTQGLLVGWLQKRFGEPKLAFGGLAVTALCLALVGASASGWLLYPVVGALAVGAWLALSAVALSLPKRRTAPNPDTDGGVSGSAGFPEKT